MDTQPKGKLDAPGKSVKRGSLLFVDDEPSICRVCATLFGVMEGYEVHMAFNAYDAFRILGRHEIHVVVTNVRMPPMDGLKMSELIRLEFPACAVIILTAYWAGGHWFPLAAEAGVSDIVFKPFKIGYLTYSVEAAVRIGPSWRSDFVQALLAGASEEYIQALLRRRDAGPEA